MSNEVKERKKRSRRNYQAEFQRVADYCQIRIEVLQSININPTNPADEGRWQMAIDAYRDILARLNGAK